MSEYRLKTGRVGKRAERAYGTIENMVVSGYKKIEEKFVDAFLEKIDKKEQ